MTRRILIFHNAFAAKGKSRVGLSKINTALHLEKIEHCVINSLTGQEENRALLQQTHHEFKPTEIWVSGGDGTLHLFINSLPEGMWHLPVAVLPTGTGNDFVKNYNTNPSFNNCLQHALRGRPTPVDVWQYNNNLFIHGLGIGFDGQVVEGLLTKKTIFKGFMAYYYHVLRLLLTYREKKVVMTANREEYTFPFFMITVANSTTFGGGFKITPKAKISDGLLDVCAISAVPVWKRPAYLKKVEHGRHLELKYVNYFSTGKITLKTVEITPGQVDGELFYGQEFEISLFAKKLPVLINDGNHTK